MEGDLYYGAGETAVGLPEEKDFQGGVSGLNLAATAGVAELGRQHGFNVRFYVLPVSELAMKGVPQHVFDTALAFLAEIDIKCVRPLIDFFRMRERDFVVGSKVIARGRAEVAEDFIARLRADPALAGPGAGRSSAQENDPVALAVEKIEKVGQ
jgi:hypothetical protein